MGLGFELWKLKAIFLGHNILRNITAEKELPKIGCCCPNGLADIEAANKMEAVYYRIPLEKALELEVDSISNPYILLLHNLKGGTLVDSDFQYRDVVDYINKYLPLLKIKPKIILCTNEQNQISEVLAKRVREVCPEVAAAYPVAKGPYTSCTENAALKKYYEIFKSGRPLYWLHAMNFYLKPVREGKRFQNYTRKCLLAFLVRSLRSQGVTHFMITEAHDASMAREGYPDQGDYVYASKEGWKEILEVSAKLGIDLVLYYQAPFLNYDGNGML